MKAENGLLGAVRGHEGKREGICRGEWEGGKRSPGLILGSFWGFRLQRG
jgi:hypothetical protein